MIITKLHIENFGKLHDFDMNFTDGINQIYKENGWGKSSLSIFIKALLYGMPAKARGDSFNYERSRFSPWQGGLYGGFLQIKTANIEYKITRFFGKTPEGDSLEILDLTNNQKLQNLNKEIGEILFGVGRESFEVTAFFPQLKFISSANSQITASLTGADKFQNDLANFNQAIKIIDAKISSLKKEKPKKEDIENLHRHIDENKMVIEIESKKNLNCREKLNDLYTLLVVSLVIVLIVVYAMPKFADKEQKIVENKLAATFGYGALALILVPFVCLLLFCTILGILPSIVLLLVYLFIIMQVATPLVAIAMAKIICQKINKNTKGFTLLFSMLLVLAIWVLELIPVLGSIVSLLTAILGLGIIVYAIFHSTIEPKKDSKKDDKIVAEASAIIETNGKDEENK